MWVAFPNAHPSSKHRRAHKRICGTIEGYTKLIESEAVSDDEHDEHHSDEDIEKTPSTKIEKKIVVGIEEKSYKSEDDLFSDAVTEFSDSGFSTPGAEERFIDLKKVDENLEVFVTPDTEDRNGSHKDKFTADVESSNTDNKDEKTEAEYVLSVPSDIPLEDHAETLLQDFKDHKNGEIGSVVDNFEVKIMEEKIEESQPCKNGESTMEDSAVSEPTNESGVVLNEEYIQETVKEDESVVESEQKIVESVGGDSSSRNSLDANWGSVSVLSTASIDTENPHSISKSEISSDKSRLGKSDAFEGPLTEVKEEIVDQKASEVNAVKVKVEESQSQPPKSEVLGIETEGRKRNEDAIAKVTNWSTSEHISAPKKNLVSDAKSSSPKQVKIQKEEAVEKVSEVGKSNLVNQESSPPKYIGEGKKVRKKAKGRVSWVPFGCCSSVNVSG